MRRYELASVLYDLGFFWIIFVYSVDFHTFDGEQDVAGGLDETGAHIRYLVTNV
jgi:hypothetical protein